MFRRIFRNLMMVSALSVLLTAILIATAVYGVYEGRISAELRLEAEYIARALEVTEDDLAYFGNLNSGNRITLIAADGMVMYDNVADAAQMGDHSAREEVASALQTGWGESTRNSDTLSETTIYYACRMDDGNVLRIANTRSSALGIFLNVLPLIAGMLLCVVLLSLLLARNVARRIVAPINTLDLDAPMNNAAYDELHPLLVRMDQQRRQIRRQMQEMENARAELEAIMENMREGMILLDRQNNVLSMNSSAAQIFAVPLERRSGGTLDCINCDADLQDIVSGARDGRSGDMLMKRSGRIYQIFASPVLKNASVRGVVLLILDVTEHFAAEESRREFTANVSHELKTPLTSISGFAEIIRDGIAQPQDVPQFAGRICAEAARLMRLVNDILELSRLDERQGLGQKEMVDLHAMLQDLTDDFAANARKKDVHVNLQGCAAQVQGYPVLMHEMFFNLLDNAVKYTPAGGHVDVNICDEGGYVCCSVADDGIGIPKEHHAHIFERFYRVDKSHSRATGGTGLGLAIVKHAAEIHHAQLQLESELNRGTRISLRFRK